MRWCVLLMAVSVTTLVAQTRDVHRERMELALRSEEPNHEDLMKVKSARVERALRSPDQLWEFVTRPEPMYLERRAAALRANEVIPRTWLPRLWHTIGELRHDGGDGWRIQTHPLSAMIRSTSRLPPPVARRIIGHMWSPPPAIVEYPLTPEERERAPWPWQVSIALMDLSNSLGPKGEWAAGRADAEAYLTAALAIGCRTEEEADVLMEAVRLSYHFQTPSVMASLRRIALNPSLQEAAARAIDQYAEATQRTETPRAYWIGYAGVLDVLRRSTAPGVRLAAASSARFLVEDYQGEIVKRPLPAAIVLDMSNRALDRAIGVSDRHSYALYVAQMVDDPPFNPNVYPDESQYERRLAEFAGWFNAHRKPWEDLAARQQPQVDEARRLLATAQTCR